MINLSAPINSLGYGVVGRNIATRLNCALYPIGQVECEEWEQLEIYKKYNLGADNVDTNNISLRIYHQFDLIHHIGKRRHIGFPIFELNKFTQQEIAHLKAQDDIFVCSNWAKEIVQSYVDRPVHIIPLGVDRNIFHENVSPIPELLSTKFTFLNIGKWEKRKGHDIIPLAFAKAFNDIKDVRLLMCCSNPFLTPQQTQEWINLYKPIQDKVVFINRFKSQKQIAELMAVADCGIFPARAEGWNLELLEMMAMGKEVITTDYSAHKDFCDKQNSKLIPINDLESAVDNIWFHGQGEWAKITQKEIDILAELMLETYQNPKKNITGIDTSKILSWDNTVNTIYRYTKDY